MSASAVPADLPSRFPAGRSPTSAGSTGRTVRSREGGRLDGDGAGGFQ